MQTLAALVLGLIIGGVAGLSASAAGAFNEFYTSRNIICLVIGAGAGAVAGAVVGGAGAIVEAINRGR